MLVLHHYEVILIQILFKASVLVDKCDIAQQKKKLGQEIGKVAAEKSRGLFSADDWQCNK